MSDTNAVTEPLVPRTARERALCRQAYLGAADEFGVGTYRVETAQKLALAKYPDPPRELRTVTCEMEGLFEGTRATYLVTYEASKFVSRFVSKNNYDTPCSPEYDSVADFVRGARRGVSDDVLRELLALPAEPYMPVVEPAEPVQIGYAVARSNGGTTLYPAVAGREAQALSRALVDYRNRPDHSKLHRLLLGDEVPADGCAPLPQDEVTP